MDTFQFVRPIHLKMLPKTTVPVELHHFELLRERSMYGVSIVMGGTNPV
jgi:hypothetical protein